MSVLQNIPLDLDIFYKKSDIPEISLGDKVKVTIYLELPKVNRNLASFFRNFTDFRLESGRNFTRING